VYIITGAAAGVGLELAKILYRLNATVYVGARSTSRCDEGISNIKIAVPSSKGNLKPFVADLANLSTIKPAVDLFLSQEYRLDVLFLNAGVMTPPPNSKTPQGVDLELGTNCLSSFLLVSLLQPIMHNVASHFCHPNQSIRVVWVASLLNMSTPDGGVQLDDNGVPKQFKGMDNYMQSKAGVYLLAHEFSRRQKHTLPSATTSTAPNESNHGNPHSIQHITLNPGLMKTELQRHVPAPGRVLMGAIFKGPEYGALTELYAGLAPGVNDGDFVIPWGRKGEVPAHIVESTKDLDGKSVSSQFWEWCAAQTKPFM
jgi:NAD(P)-dependent dehydrogenase (short-subunit alcohol dehydrogenase family)